jgi:ubiquinone biosynthesis protein COQ4
MNGASGLRSQRSVNLGLALKALVGLARGTTRTDHVFTIISALTGNTLERTYQRFLRAPEGPRLLRERPDLAAVLSDDARLEAMPEGSLGREYLKFMRRARITSKGLMAAQDAGVDPNADVEADEERSWVADRLRDQHDLWHVLTEYGADDTGEIANLWFSVGQFGNPGMAFIAFFGTIGGDLGHALAWPRYCYRAYVRGRRASRLVSEPLEELLALPIDEVRRRLRIAPSGRVHPEGIRHGYRRDGKLGALARAPEISGGHQVACESGTQGEYA